MSMRFALILHRYDLTAENDYQLKISESITLKPRGFRLGVSKRAASSRLGAVDTELTRLSARAQRARHLYAGLRYQPCIGVMPNGTRQCSQHDSDQR